MVTHRYVRCSMRTGGGCFGGLVCVALHHQIGLATRVRGTRLRGAHNSLGAGRTVDQAVERAESEAREHASAIIDAPPEYTGLA